MKIKFYLILICSSLFSNCSINKNLLTEKGDINDAIHNAIEDFAKTRFFRKDSVFFVGTLSTSSSEVLFGISIIGTNLKFLIKSSDKQASYANLPSRFLVKENKIFLWDDKTFPVSDSTIAVFEKFGLLKDDLNGSIKFLPYHRDDTKKSLHYFFCKNNLKKYKRKVTSIALGFYSAPHINCE